MAGKPKKRSIKSPSKPVKKRVAKKAAKSTTPKKPSREIAPSPEPPTVDPPKLTHAQIAKKLGVNRRTLSEWFERGCPREPIEAIAAWRVKHLRPERMDPAHRESANAAAVAPSAPEGRKRPSLIEQQTKANIRKINADVDFRRLKVAEIRKDLVSRSSVQREVAALCVRVKERLLAAPEEFQNSFPAETRIQNKIDFEDFVRHLLMELASWKVGGVTTDEMIIAAAQDIQVRTTQRELEDIDLAEPELAEPADESVAVPEPTAPDAIDESLEASAGELLDDESPELESDE